MNRIYLGLAIIPALVLAACGGDGEEEDPEDTEVFGTDDGEATELTYWTFQQLHIDLFESAVDRWNEENPDDQVTLVAEVFPYDQMHNNLRLALQSGEGAPDIADIEISEFGTFLEGEPQFESMNEYVEPIFDDAVEERFEIYAQDGEYYGTPYHIGATVMYYNTEIMDEAGVDIDSIETWDDYVEAGQQVVNNTDSMMATVETEDDFGYWAMVSQQGSDFFDENGDLTLDNGINISTLQFLQDMVYEHEIAEPAPGGEHHAEEFYGYMNDGGAASVLMPMWYMGRFTDYMEDLEGKIEIRPMPTWEEGGNRTAGMGGTGTVVTNQTENPELAKGLMSEAKISEEANIALWTDLGFDPPRYSVWDSEEVLEDNQFYQFFGDDIFDLLAELTDEVEALNVTPDTASVANELNTNVFNEAIRNEGDPERALNDAAEAVRSGATD
ncbi:arabinosaccharide transport system substrate-binding protein [Geomicrobium halophilum]|uniref:Arabinosaccharide transport system substrate-binding protein n=1 Tax=Geomicrobium halophilum TaxID=549000 RepID=A0A841Q073_9BACL|nr:arabinosaccharide transport system substrate-binding protein [Geomicrobium halophilum]